MKKAVINLEELACPTCMQKIEAVTASVKGVDKPSIKVMFNASKLKVNFNEKEVTVEEIEKAIEDIGYPVIKSKVVTI
ncbi:MAG TPA: cation transporter [Ligilactobacillus acidipiscis]|uniref:Cation transporter n=1 Tax=Ligilactobacillus acidipiscis TaxID=89059 RepID=A0A921F798_9LACO|nr:cation transporter [Ligilactobacillus acidipiscis]